MMSSVGAVDRDQWFGAAVIRGLPSGWPWLHEYVSLAQTIRLSTSTATQNREQQHKPTYTNTSKGNLQQNYSTSDIIVNADIQSVSKGSGPP